MLGLKLLDATAIYIFTYRIKPSHLFFVHSTQLHSEGAQPRNVWWSEKVNSQGLKTVGQVKFEYLKMYKERLESICKVYV